jgi:hypothetical protein
MSDQTKMTDKEKIEFLLASLEDLRSTLDEAISFLDDTAIQIDERG